MDGLSGYWGLLRVSNETKKYFLNSNGGRNLQPFIPMANVSRFVLVLGDEPRCI